MGQRKFAMGWKLGFFLAACCVIAAGVVGVIDLALFAFAPFDLVNEIYLLIFGLMMLVIDFPVPHQDAHPKIQLAKLKIYDYFLFMTRFTGRGIWYLFLGTMIVASLWDLSISPFLGFILGGYVVFLGFASIFQGVTKSMKLEKVRGAMLKRGNAFDLCPAQGLSPGAFNDMSNSTAGIRFTDEELHYIFDALSFTVRSDDVISKEEFCEWVRPGTKMLIL